MTSAHIRQSDRTPIDRGNGAATVQMLTPSEGAQDLVNGFTTLPPGRAIPLHYHNCEESVLIVEGTASVHVDGVQTDARTGDVIWIPADIPHFFANPSPTDALRIFWTYASAQATRTLVESRKTGRIFAESPPEGALK
ncbi:MAG: putative monooxygenase [Paracoccaceae bacterium]|jgi:quercetin dioxygenase-like cupin family protein